MTLYCLPDQIYSAKRNGLNILVQRRTNGRTDDGSGLSPITIAELSLAQTPNNLLDYTLYYTSHNA